MTSFPFYPILIADDHHLANIMMLYFSKCQETNFL